MHIRNNNNNQVWYLQCLIFPEKITSVDGLEIEIINIKIEIRRIEMVTGQLADTPTRGLPTRGLEISRTGQVADGTTRGLPDAAKKENYKHAIVADGISELSSNHWHRFKRTTTYLSFKRLNV